MDKPMTVREAGRRGGLTTSQRHGRDFYVKIGSKGGRRVRELVQLARATEKGPVQQEETPNDQNH